MIPRTLHSVLLERAAMFPVISLSGPRQSGKTTLVRATFPDHAYLNLENLDVQAAAAEDPRGFLLRLAEQGGIIDEAQKVPALFSYMQQLADETRRMGTFVLTGSQNFLLNESITQSLAGRTAVVKLLPFDIQELRNASLAPEQLSMFLYSGSYPALYDRAIPPEIYYPSYLQTYIERDVRSLKNIGNLHVFQRFLRLCAGRIGQLVNLATIGAEVGIDAKTVRSWLSVLEASYMIFFLEPYFNNFNKRLVKSPKLYFFDTGVVCSLLGLNSPGQIDYFYLRGQLFENFVISEYVKMRMHAGRESHVSFWRDSSGTEIDLLIDTAGQLYAVEIKAGMTVNLDFFAGLQKFRKYSGVPAENCFLVYGGEEQMQRKAAYVLGWRSISALP
jgi:predicted AAA+ superfamily ATPase